MQKNINDLLKIMERLRNPDNGCPWDVKQTFETIVPYTIEEAYEVLDAIERNDYNELRDELGDLLLQVVFHSQMANEAGLFDFNDVSNAICEKMIRRHPHVFGDFDREKWASDALGIWEEQKKQEREGKEDKKPKGTLDGVALSLPALLRAYKLQKRAAMVGFDWRNAGEILDKIEEEIAEVREVIEADKINQDNLEEEIGDLLFACVNYSRKQGIDPEIAMRKANNKFEERFRHIEKRLIEQNKDIKATSLEEMEELWNEAKALEKAGKQLSA